MRAHIRWVSFLTKDSGCIIKNNENNENWPSSDDFVNIIEQWEERIEGQQKAINKIESDNLKIRQLIANIRTWFINEHNLLNKPAKRNLLEKQLELRKLERELKIIRHDLEYPKTPLEEYEKECLQTKIEIGERRVGNCKLELEEAEKAYENEKRELCKRLSYEKRDLEPFLEELKPRLNLETNEIENPYHQYSEWWRIHENIHPSEFYREEADEANDAPLNKLRRSLEKWWKFNGGWESEHNPYEIWVEEKRNDSLIFAWKPVKQELEQTNKKGEKIKVKGKFLPLLKNYLFNYYGEWYEVSDYEQIGYDLIAVHAERSIFYNDYWNLNKCQANVILHHSPLSQEEICSCPTSEYYSSQNIFFLNYELKFDLYRLGKEERKRVVHSRLEDPMPFIFSGEPENVTKNRETRGETYIPPRPASFSENVASIIPGMRVERPTGRIGSTAEYEAKRINNFWNDYWKSPVKSDTILYFLYGQNRHGLNKHGKWGTGTFFDWTWEVPHTLENITRLSEERRKYCFEFRTVGDYDEEKQITSLSKKDNLEKFLAQKRFLLPEMHHFLKDHVKAELFWRNKFMWKGNFWTLLNDMRVTESINNSGTRVTIEGSNNILCYAQELTTIKIGDNKKGADILNTIINVGTTISSAAGLAMGGPAGSFLAGSAFKAGGGIAKQAFNKLTETTPHHESFESMSIHEFRHKYLNSKNYPISLKISFSQEAANQYLNKRQLKGKMLYTYANFENFGVVLSQANHYLKASVISWNMTRNSNWFREKIESGIFLYSHYQDFYRKKLAGPLATTSLGGIIRSSWDEFTSQKNYGVKGGHDGIAHLGGGFFAYKIKDGKPNFIKDKETDQDFLPEIMDELGRNHHNLIVENNDSMWKLDWKTEFVNHRWDVPEKYKKKREGNELDACDMEFRLKFFTGGDESLEGEKFYVTHILITKTTQGTRSDLLFDFVGEMLIKNRSSQNPASIPPATQLPIDPSQKNPPETATFNPNKFPSSGNLIPNPTGSGEPEIRVPSIDVSPDPDFDPNLDVDFGKDPGTDPTKDIDKTIEIELPKDTSDDDDND